VFFKPANDVCHLRYLVAGPHVLKNSWRKRNVMADVVLPALSFPFCLTIWVSLQTPAKVIGGIWFAAGIAYDALKTRGFCNSPVLTDFSEF